jgi:hypothetical protein
MGNSSVPSRSSPSHEQARAIEDSPSAKTATKDGATAPMTIDENSVASLGAGNGNEKNKGGELRPPLPPRPSLLQTNRPITSLQSKATTTLSSVDIETLSFPDGSRGTFTAPTSRAVSESISGISGGQSTPSRKVSHNGSEVDDNASLMSCAPTLRANGDLASLLDEGLNVQSPAWRLLSTQTDTVNPFETFEYEDTSLVNFEHEFDEIEAVDSKRGNEGTPT